MKKIVVYKVVGKDKAHYKSVIAGGQFEMTYVLNKRIMAKDCIPLRAWNKELASQLGILASYPLVFLNIEEARECQIRIENPFKRKLVVLKGTAEKVYPLLNRYIFLVPFDLKLGRVGYWRKVAWTNSYFAKGLILTEEINDN